MSSSLVSPPRARWGARFPARARRGLGAALTSLAALVGGAALGRVAVVASAAALASGCAGFQHFSFLRTQRWPEPMEAAADPLLPGDAGTYLPGPEQVRVLRHADPVQVRQAGSSGSFPLTYRRKEVRVQAGSSVHSGAGGRAETLWEGGSAVLYGLTTVVLGSKSRGEPTLILRELERIRFQPESEDVFELVGGAQLRARSGPVFAERMRDGIVRVSNQSKRSAEVAFREETITLDPGQAVDLPRLSVGDSPTQVATTAVPGTELHGFAAKYTGDTRFSLEGSALSARGRGEVRALGVRVTLGEGDEARFSGSTAPPAPDAAATVPAAATPQ